MRPRGESVSRFQSAYVGHAGRQKPQWTQSATRSGDGGLWASKFPIGVERAVEGEVAWTMSSPCGSSLRYHLLADPEGRADLTVVERHDGSRGGLNGGIQHVSGLGGSSVLLDEEPLGLVMNLVMFRILPELM